MRHGTGRRGRTAPSGARCWFPTRSSSGWSPGSERHPPALGPGIVTGPGPVTPARTTGEAMESRNIERVKVAIVGAGTAGLAALREVRARTDDFVLINAGPYGSTCARVGCMPSKALIAAANAFHARTKLDEFGVRGGRQLRADVPAVLRRVRSLRDGFVAGVLEATEELGARNIAGRARLDGPTR